VLQHIENTGATTFKNLEKSTGIDLRLFWTTTLKVFSLSFRAFPLSFIYFASFTRCIRQKMYRDATRAQKRLESRSWYNTQSLERWTTTKAQNNITLEFYTYYFPTFLTTIKYK